MRIVIKLMYILYSLSFWPSNKIETLTRFIIGFCQKREIHNISTNNTFGNLLTTQSFLIGDVASICAIEDVVQLISSILVHFYAYFDHYM